MNRIISCSVFLLVLCTSVSMVYASTIAVQNWSFESPVLTGTGSYYTTILTPPASGAIPGWTTSTLRDGGVLLPGSSRFTSGVPHEDQCAWVDGGDSYGGISQGLLGTIMSGVTYTLLVDVGYRKDLTSLPLFSVSFTADGAPLRTASSPQPAKDGWSTVTVIYDEAADPGPDRVGEEIGIMLSSNGNQVCFDNVRLSDTVVPIPSAIWLLGTGLFGIVGIRKKFKK